MPRRKRSSESGSTLPPQARHLIDRKINIQHRELTKELTSRKQQIDAALNERVQEFVSNRKAHTGSIFFATYHELRDLAIEFSEKWPPTIAEIIAGTLESTHIQPSSASELKEILSEATRAKDFKASAERLIDPDRLEDGIARRLQSYGLQRREPTAQFQRARALEAGLARSALQDTVRESMENANLALDEFTMRFETPVESQAPKPITHREDKPAPTGVMKPETQAKHRKLQKAYRRLRKENPKQTATWIANQIAKLPDGEGYRPDTIRKNMKK